MGLNDSALAWMQSLQFFSTLGAAMNFGGSALQSPLIWPMLQLPIVPVKYSSQQTVHTLHHSEFFFPPLNAACGIANLISTVTAYNNRATNPAAAAKFPYLLTATLANIFTTVYTVLVMVPWNRKQYALAKFLKDHDSEAKEREFRDAQTSWLRRNFGRAIIMITASAASMMSLLVPEHR